MTRAAKLGDLKVIVDKRILAHRIEKSHKSNQFVSLARAIMLGNGKVIDTCETGLPESLQNIVKAGVAAGSVGGSHWADELASYNSLASSFVESLSGYGVFDKLLSAGAFVRVPLRTNVSMVSTGASG
jgi:hypothetical protein